jgi:hypothetical protein
MSQRLTLKLDSRVHDDPVPFDAFAEMVAHTSDLLTELDVARTGSRSTRWVVRELRAGSALVEIEAVPVNPLFDMSVPVARDFTSALSTVARERRRPDGVSDQAWRDTQAIIRILQDGIGTVTIDAGETGRVVLSEPTVAEEDEPLVLGSPEVAIEQREALSTIEGSLETVNAHDPRQMHFALWDVLHNRRIRCDFGLPLVDDVRRGLLERVRVYGLVTFDPLGHPVRVADVRSIHVLGRDVRRPSPQDLRGLVPNLTGGLGSVEWVRRIRDA